MSTHSIHKRFRSSHACIIKAPSSSWLFFCVANLPSGSFFGPPRSFLLLLLLLLLHPIFPWSLWWNYSGCRCRLSCLLGRSSNTSLGWTDFFFYLFLIITTTLPWHPFFSYLVSLTTSPLLLLCTSTTCTSASATLQFQFLRRRITLYSLQEISCCSTSLSVRCCGYLGGFPLPTCFGSFCRAWIFFLGGGSTSIIVVMRSRHPSWASGSSYRFLFGFRSTLYYWSRLFLYMLWIRGLVIVIWWFKIKSCCFCWLISSLTSKARRFWWDWASFAADNDGCCWFVLGK